MNASKKTSAAKTAKSVKPAKSVKTTKKTPLAATRVQPEAAKAAGKAGKSSTAGARTTKASRAGQAAGKSTKSGAVSKTVLNPKATSKETAALIAEKLMAFYPDADCELDFKSDFQLLTAVILSAQCTDQQVNKVTAKLYKSYPTARTLAEADIESIKEIVRPTGYFNAKAKNIQACAQALVTKYGGEVPQTQEELTELPGVGRKTANVVLGVAHNIPGWTVDTHVQRLSKRLGFTKENDPYKIEMDLQKLFPQNKFDWTKLSITIIWHGRRCCFARKPDCAHCPVQDLCPSSEV